MKRTLSAFALVTVAALAAVACGSDDDSSPGSGGKSSSAGKSSTGGDSSGPVGGATEPGGGDTSTAAGAPSSGNVMCDPTQDGVCQNATDCPFIVDGTARITSGNCGKGCIGKAETCSRDCIVMKIAMTPECATCYADTVNCTIKNCTGECFADPEADVCKQCQVDSGCRAAFDTCSGLPG